MSTAGAGRAGRGAGAARSHPLSRARSPPLLPLATWPLPLPLLRRSPRTRSLPGRLLPSPPSLRAPGAGPVPSARLLARPGCSAGQRRLPASLWPSRYGRLPSGPCRAPRGLRAPGELRFPFRCFPLSVEVCGLRASLSCEPSVSACAALGTGKDGTGRGRCVRNHLYGTEYFQSCHVHKSFSSFLMPGPCCSCR